MFLKTLFYIPFYLKVSNCYKIINQNIVEILHIYKFLRKNAKHNINVLDCLKKMKIKKLEKKYNISF